MSFQIAGGLPSHSEKIAHFPIDQLAIPFGDIRRHCQTIVANFIGQLIRAADWKRFSGFEKRQH
jgi:hypothetical protein